MIWPTAMLIAIGLDLIFGWPDGLFKRIGHPVTWIGRLITVLERRLNRSSWSESTRRFSGLVALLIIIAIPFAIALLISITVPSGWLGLLITGVLAAPFVASKSLYQHVKSVAVPLAKGNVPTARIEVAKIVGRDPNTLDEAAISRATLESLAENASDGIIAPVFWGLLLGLPGIVAYKAINTADSMIGHRNDRYRMFGWAAARLDDLVNWPPARITALLLAVVSGRFGDVLRATLRDAGKHRSPNAGWPESAMAASLNRRLSGPRSYDGLIGNEPWLNADGNDPDASDIMHGLSLARRALVLASAILFILAVI